MKFSQILKFLLVGAGIGGFLLILDNGVDLYAPDDDTTWFVGPVHVPTLLAGLGAIVVLIGLWGFSYTTGEWVVGGIIATLGALVWARVSKLFLPVFNAALALLGASVPWYQSEQPAP